MVKLTEKQFAWLQAFFVICVLWGLNNVVDIYSIRALEVNPVLYSCSAFASSAFFLMLYAGKGPLALETMRSIDTWIFGVCVLLAYIVGLNLFSVLSATEGTLINRFSMVTALLASWFFLSRKPTSWQLLGNGIVGISVIVICEGADVEVQPLVYMLMLLYALFQTIRVFSAEFHKPHNQAMQMDMDPKARCRVVGFVMFIVSTMFLAMTLLVATIQSAGGGEKIIPGFPLLIDFLHAPSIFMGLLIGVIFIAPIRLIEFSAINKINTANFLAVASLSFVATWFWEWLLQPVTGIALSGLSTTDIFAGFAITFGGIIAVFGSMSHKKKNSIHDYMVYEVQDIELVHDSREIVANTLEQFDMNIKKAADSLGVPAWVIEAILSDDDKIIAFKDLNKVSRSYRSHVASRDALTGLLNRSGFMVALKKAMSEHKTGVLLYIDLDKFKPVNDTFGHDAGDAVLIQTAERLKQALPENAIITRMGGDEFCAFVPSIAKTKAGSLPQKLKTELGKPYRVKGIRKNIEVGASIGSATYPHDATTPQDLISAADEGMYGVKHSVEG